MSISKKILIILFIVLFASYSWGVGFFRYNPHTNKLDYYGALRSSTVANLPAASSSNQYEIYIVTDANGKDDCTSGSGTDVNICISDGTNWVDQDAAGEASGDVTKVGDCNSGDCLDGSSDGGTYIRLYDAAANYLQLDVTGALGSNKTINLNAIDVSDYTNLGVGDTVTLSGDNITIADGAIASAKLADADFGDFTVSSGSATLDNDVVAAAEMADADHGDVAWSSGAATVQDFTLAADADAGDYDIKSVDKLEGVDTGVYIDMGADTIVEIEADGSIKLQSPDIIQWEAVNDANPEIRQGGADAEEVIIQTVFDSGAQTVDYLLIQTQTADATADEGRVIFQVDEQQVLQVDDAGIEVGANGVDGTLKLYSEQGDTDYGVVFQPAAAMTETTTYTLPAADGTTGQYLYTDGSGALAWGDPSGTGGDITAVGNFASGAAFTEAATAAGILYFEGATPNDYEIALASDNPAADYTITLPDQTGHVLLGAAAGYSDNVLVKADGATSHLTQATGITVDDSNNMSGIGTISSGAITSTGTSTFGTAANPDASDGAALGSTDAEWSDLYIADSGYIYFGDDQDVSILHDPDTGIRINSTTQLQFRDNAIHIASAADGHLDLTADTSIDLNGAVVATSTIAASGAISGNNVNPDTADGATLGTTSLEWSDAYFADSSVIYFGADQEITLTHSPDTGLVMADQDYFMFGSNEDWQVHYDETTDDNLMWTTSAVQSAATTTGMFQIIVDDGSLGTTPANQEIFEIKIGSTEIFSVDEDGDVTAAGSLLMDEISVAAQDDPWWHFDPSTSGESDWWIGTNHDSEGDDDDAWEVRQSETAGTNVMFSVAASSGDAVVAGDLTITGDDLVMGTNTAGMILVADDTNFNPVAVSGDATMGSTGAVAVGDLTITGEAQGEILYHNGSGWESLDVGTSGQFLKTQGASANPVWASVTATAAGADTQIQYNNSGSLGAESGLTWTAASDNLKLPGAAGAIYIGDDPADVATDGLFLNNAGDIAFEASPAGTDVVAMTVDTSEVVILAESGATLVQIAEPVKITHDDAYLLLDSLDAQDSDWWIVVDADQGASADDPLEIGNNATVGTSPIISVAHAGGVTLSSTLAMSGAFSGATTISQTHTAPTFTMNDSDGADGTANILFQANGAYDMTGTVQADVAGTPATFITLDGVNSDLILAAPDDVILDPGGDVIQFVSTTETMTLTNGSNLWTFDSAGDTFVFSDAVDIDGASTATTYVADTSIETPYIILNAVGSAADAGAIRLANADNIAWEADEAGTDVVGISVDSSEVVQIAPSGSSGVTITPALTLSSTLTDGTATLNSGAWSGISTLAMTGALSGVTTVTASTGFVLGDEDYIGVTGNEVITFDTDGEITISGANLVIGDNADVDYILKFDADTDDATLTWDEDNSNLVLTTGLATSGKFTLGNDDDSNDDSVDLISHDGGVIQIYDADDDYSTTISVTDVSSAAQLNVNSKMDVDGAFTASTVTSDAGVSGTTGTFSGIVTGLVNTTVDPANLSNFNGTFAVSGTSYALTLPTAAAGYSVCLYQGQGRTDALSVTPAAGDYLVVDGVRKTVATAYASTGAAGDRICVVSVSADDWIVTSKTGTWSE